MSFATLVIMSITLLGTLASAGFSTRCPNPSSSCTAVATSTVSAMSTGGLCTVRASSNAFCETFPSEFQGCFGSGSFYGDGGCRVVSPETDAECFAMVSAAAFASAFVRADCAGQSIGCGSANSFADAEVVSCFTVNSIVQLVQSLGPISSICSSALANLVDVKARAAADAEAAACSSSGVVGLDADFSFDISVQNEVVSALRQCFIYCDDLRPATPSPATPSPTPSPPATPSPTPTPAPATPSPTPTPAPATPSPSPSDGGMAVAMADASVDGSGTASAEATATVSPAPPPPATPSPTPTPAPATPSPTPTPAPATPSPTPTPAPATPSPSPSDGTVTATASDTATSADGDSMASAEATVSASQAPPASPIVSVSASASTGTI